MEFLDLLKEVGFENAELVAKTGFNSTPKTEGVLLRATRPESSINIQEKKQEARLEEVHRIAKKSSPSIEAVIDRAYALGCEKAKIIDTSAIIVEKWVRWKCLYGCPFYNKDGYHPPLAPSLKKQKRF